MQAVAHNPSFAKKVGVPQSVGREFTKKDGGQMKNTSRMNKLEEMGRLNAEKAKTPMGKKNLAAEKKRVIGELNKGMGMKSGGKAYAKGGLAAGHKSADGVATKGKTKARQVKMMGGGKC